MRRTCGIACGTDLHREARLAEPEAVHANVKRGSLNLKAVHAKSKERLAEPETVHAKSKARLADLESGPRKREAARRFKKAKTDKCAPVRAHF